MLLSKLAPLVGVQFNGDDKEIISLNTLENACENEASYIDNPRYLDSLSKTKAGAVFVQKAHMQSVPKGCSALVCDNPHLALAQVSVYFAPSLAKTTGPKALIDSSATIFPNVYIGHGASIGKDVVVMAGAYIGDDAQIADGCIIHPGVVIYPRSILGKRCHIMANAVIGSDGFGYAHTQKGEHIKIHHLGNVVLEDDVEIGACSTIDRAVFGTTLVKKGTKVDNLVQIAHNCKLGEGCIIVSQTGISGSTTLGRNVIMGGQSATSGHLSIGDFATVAARGGVSKSLSGGKVYGGFPILLQKDWLKLQAKIARFFTK
jgi:UDP-3-O-[3-hydroxymyristoyl] glucosamine N-acyltransferase